MKNRKSIITEDWCRKVLPIVRGDHLPESVELGPDGRRVRVTVRRCSTGYPVRLTGGLVVDARDLTKRGHLGPDGLTLHRRLRVGWTDGHLKGAIRGIWLQMLLASRIADSREGLYTRIESIRTMNQETLDEWYNIAEKAGIETCYESMTQADLGYWYRKLKNWQGAAK